ncbi:MAG: diaminobutyrate acetyltransferase [Syntrophaceae bacterium]
MDSSTGILYDKSGIVFRKPEIKDGAGIYALVKRSKPLDVNSLYSYILLSAHFADTCIVADIQGDIVGYISGFLPPGFDDTLFVWQVAVGEEVRKKGVAISMVKALLQRPCLSGVKWIDTTVTPSNDASTRLFQSLARILSTSLHTSVFFTEDLFEGQSHEEEVLFRIGPFSRD